MVEDEIEEPRGPNGRVTGSLDLKSRPGTPAGGEREFVIFTAVDIIIAASDWIVTGTALTRSGQERSYRLRIREEINQFTLVIGDLRFVTIFPNEVSIVNDAPNERLSVSFDRPFFSENDPAFFLDPSSVFHVERNQ